MFSAQDRDLSELNKRFSRSLYAVAPSYTPQVFVTIKSRASQIQYNNHDEISCHPRPSFGIGFCLCPCRYSTTIFGFVERRTKQSSSFHEPTCARKSPLEIDRNENRKNGCRIENDPFTGSDPLIASCPFDYWNLTHIIAFAVRCNDILSFCASIGKISMV